MKPRVKDTVGHDSSEGATEMKQTLDQKRAADAWEVIRQVGSVQKEEKDQFGIQVKKLPTRIITSGLGQALAFLEAKQSAPRLRQALDNWLDSRRPVRQGQEKRLVVRVIQGDAEFLRFATAECMSYLQWLVKFADAEGLIKDEVESNA